MNDRIQSIRVRSFPEAQASVAIDPVQRGRVGTARGAVVENLVKKDGLSLNCEVR